MQIKQIYLACYNHVFTLYLLFFSLRARTKWKDSSDDPMKQVPCILLSDSSSEEAQADDVSKLLILIFICRETVSPQVTDAHVTGGSFCILAEQ